MIFVKNNDIKSLHTLLSENFRASEFRCSCYKCGITMVHPVALHLLQSMRSLFGRTLILTSAYRCQELNARVPGASPTSYHTRGMAFDIDLSVFSENERAELKRLAKALFTGHYITPLFLHVDIRGFETRTI